MEFQNKKISVVGGSGFVGTNLCQKLSEKNQDFEIIDIKMSKQFPERCSIGDVRDVESLRRTITGDILINLAAVHRDDVKSKQEYQNTNVKGAKNLAIICSEKKIKKIVFTSSVAVYGSDQTGTGENGQLKPSNDYGRSKLEAEKYFEKWQKSNNSSLIIIRPTVIFGVGNRGNVYNLFNQIASKKFLMIGYGDNIKSLAYISNVIAFLDKCIETETKFKIYNYVDTPNLTMNDLVKLVRVKLFDKDNVGLRIPFWLGLGIGFTFDFISKLLGKKLPISSVRIKKFSMSTEFTSAKAELDNFTEPYDLIEGINVTLENEFVNPAPQREVFFTE